MTREQKLEAAMRRIEDLVGSIARESIELPPDPNTRVVTVDQLERWASSMPHAFKSYKEIRAIIGEVK